MPYKLRKAPNRELYWVVAEDGSKKSKDPIPKERAKAQMRALYANMKGGGVEDDMKYMLINELFRQTVKVASKMKKTKITKQLFDQYDSLITNIKAEAESFLARPGATKENKDQIRYFLHTVLPEAIKAWQVPAASKESLGFGRPTKRGGGEEEDEMKGLFDQEPAAAMYRPVAPLPRRQNLFEPAPVRRVKRKAVKRKLHEITGFPDVPFGRHESRRGGLSPQQKTLAGQFISRVPTPSVIEVLEDLKSRMTRKEKKEYMLELGMADELVNEILMSQHNHQAVQNNTFDYDANRDFFETVGVENNRNDLLKFFEELIDEQSVALHNINVTIYQGGKLAFEPLPSVKARRGGKCCTCDQKRGGIKLKDLLEIVGRTPSLGEKKLRFQNIASIWINVSRELTLTQVDFLNNQHDNKARKINALIEELEPMQEALHSLPVGRKGNKEKEFHAKVEELIQLVTDALQILRRKLESEHQQSLDTQREQYQKRGGFGLEAIKTILRRAIRYIYSRGNNLAYYSAIFAGALAADALTNPQETERLFSQVFPAWFVRIFTTFGYAVGIQAILDLVIQPLDIQNANPEDQDPVNFEPPPEPSWLQRILARRQEDPKDD
jgi:hypothetical protein